jgi:hypothetical protein
MKACSRAALLLALALAFGCGRDAPPKPPEPAEVASADGHIDPAPYRPQIEAAEALLYRDQGLELEGWKELSRALLDLHNAIVFRDNSAPARQTSRRVLFFSAQVESEAAASHHVEDQLAVMRGVWEQIRSDQFTRADWFKNAAR